MDMDVSIENFFFFFFFFCRSSSKNHSYTSKLLDTFGNWQTRSAVGTDRITESDGEREKERERVVGGVKNAKGAERCYREGLENCSSVGKSPTCSSQIFTSISVRLELNLE